MSDQDFFFEEEPAPKAPKPEKQGRGARKSAPQPPAKRKDAAPVPAPFFDRRTTYVVALLIGVIGLLVGVLGGYLLGSAPVRSSGTAAPSSQSAPALPAAGAAGSGAATTTQ